MLFLLAVFQKIAKLKRMKKTLHYYLLALLALSSITGYAANEPDIKPTDLEFQRLAVRRFIFSAGIPLSEFAPAEIVAFHSMHPAFLPNAKHEPKPDESFKANIEAGKLLLEKKNTKANEASIYVGAVNPYATYEINIDSINPEKGKDTEIGVELARFGLRDKVQVFVRANENESAPVLRIFKDAKNIREIKYDYKLPAAPYSLIVQLYGRSLGVFVKKDGETKYISHIPNKEHFGDAIDFRNIAAARQCTFNIFSNLSGRAVVAKASSSLSIGMGQADIRLVSYEDLSPYMDTDNRLWFTISCRGIETSQAFQGVISLDPTVFDIRMEGAIVFDHGDGLLRNDYASHLFYDRKAKEWRAYTCDFGGTHKLDRRSKTGLALASSSKDPRKGYSVMQAKRIEPEQIEGHNEDPCIFFDNNAKKWRLLTSAFINKDIVSRTYESDTWDGKFTEIAPPIALNSTGTSIQKIGKNYYALMGGKGNLRIHSYPDLKEIGELNLPLQPHWPKPAGRIWASIAPLPEGFPYKYVLLTMDRANFPNIRGANWSYGALYLYGANE